MTRLSIAVLSFSPFLFGCGTYHKLAAPAVPYATETPKVGAVPEGRLRDILRDGELVVLGTPLERASEAGLFTATLQMGSKETWYSVRIAVDSVAKGNPRRARKVDLGTLPGWLNPGHPFPALAENEIVVQYPEVESPRAQWGLAPALTLGEQAVFVFKKCWNCVQLRGITVRGPYYQAHPWVAMTWGSKLPPEEWSRVVSLVRDLQAKRAAR